MKHHNTRFLLALISLFFVFGCLKPVDKKDQDKTADVRQPAPRFALDIGMLDYWGKKKDGPFQMEISPNGKHLMFIGHQSKANVQVWDLEK